MNSEYYLGYVRDPGQVIENGFQDIKEIEIILKKENNEFYEITTGAKLYALNNNQVIDYHKVFENNASLIGRIDYKLTFYEVRDYLTGLEELRKSNYTDKIVELINKTLERANIGEKEYQDEIKRFKKTFRK